MEYKTPNCSRKRSFFSTAAAESSIVEEVDQQGAPTNIYLSPLATKVKALRFASYWQLEGRLRGKVSILLPEDSSYLQETTTGLKRRAQAFEFSRRRQPQCPSNAQSIRVGIPEQ